MLKPHQSKYWEHPNISDWEAFAQQVTQICLLRKESKQLAQAGVHVYSIDEKPGIQAIERAGKTLPMQRGKVERREFNYIRHGTQALTANLNLATGKLITPTIEHTRTEKDFVLHIDTLIKTDPEASFIFLVDQLNTHKSESLVRYVANAVGDRQNLGEKGKTGILKNMQTRAAYLCDKTHRIRFLYTPKHCSWLNPIEVWLSVLTCHVLKRGNFISIEDLKEKILAYIHYYNEHLVKAYRWAITKEKQIEALIAKVKLNAGIVPIPAAVIG